MVRMWKEDKNMEEKEIKTVADLIEVLKEYPPDMRISYDYGLPINILRIFDDTELTIA